MKSRTRVWSRRELLASAAQSCLGVSLLGPLHTRAWGTLTENPAPRAKSVIYLFMDGGMSQLDTFDPKPGIEEMGPVTGIPTSASDVAVSEFFPKTARQMHQIAVLRSMTTNQGAHRPARELLHTSYAQETSATPPALAAWIARSAADDESLLNVAAIINPYGDYPYAGFLDPKYAPTAVGDPAKGIQHSRLRPGISESECRQDWELAQELSQGFRTQWRHHVNAYSDLYERAIRLTGSQELTAFDITRESPSTREAYGHGNFAQGCLLARRLVEHGHRFVEVVLNGWDTHTKNHARTKKLGQELDHSLAALLVDLDDRGMLDETLVVVGTEFGRTPRIASHGGRHHHVKAFSCLLAGGGVQGGRVHGATDKRGYEVEDNPVSIPDFNATIAYALGVDHEENVAVPGADESLSAGNAGEPLVELF